MKIKSSLSLSLAAVLIVQAKADEFQMVVVPEHDPADRASVLAPTHEIRSDRYTGMREANLPFLDLSAGKEGSPMAGYVEYDHRLVDFYTRQARFYVENPDQIPDVIPGFPALDGGLYSHHGAYNKNGMTSSARDEMIQGSVIQYTNREGQQYGLELGEDRSWLLLYNTKLASPHMLLKDGEVDYDDYRMSTARTANSVGTEHGIWIDNPWPGKPHFNGHYRYNGQAVMSYRLEDTSVLEQLDLVTLADEPVLRQAFYFEDGTNGETYLPALAGAEISLTVDDGWVTARFDDEDSSSLVITRNAGVETAEETQTEVKVEGETFERSQVKLTFLDSGESAGIAIFYWTGDAAQADAVASAIRGEGEALADVANSLPDRTKGGEQQWPETVTGSGRLADEIDSAPYVIDTLPIPLVNPWKSTLLLTGIDFDPDGNAYVCTLFGDVWKVSGIDESLENVTWKRMISGLNSTFGILWIDGALYVGDKAELLALHDLNGDDEIDFVERVNQSFEGHGRKVHTGLFQDAEGAFYYISGGRSVRLKDDTVETLSPELRTCMALGLTHDDRIWSAGQEGTATPTSAIHEYHDGDDVYKPDFRDNESLEDIQEKLDPALVYLPRGIDNSTACSLAVRSDDRFGFLQDKMLSFSYGACSAQYILRDKPEGAERFQGAVVNLPGYYYSGANHGAINPKDGQLYVVGHDGWGTYAVSDGSLQRLRYTDRPVYYPSGFRTYVDGVKVEFDRPLDPAVCEDVSRYFAQQWNYLYSAAYGSPEMTVSDINVQGHDHLPISDVRLVDDGTSLFFEMPSFQPAMTTHLFGKIQGADGTEFELDLYLTSLFLEDAFAEENVASMEEKPRELTLPVAHSARLPEYIMPSIRENAVKITVSVDEQLQFVIDEENQELLNNLTIGTNVIFTVVSQAQGMGHNALIVERENLEAVGAAADAMVADPRALKLAYVPNAQEVKNMILAHSPLVNPGETREFLFAVEETGNYVLLCTYPGHWRVMQISFEVVE